jgi:type I restriction enzyme, S subunit
MSTAWETATIGDLFEIGAGKSVTPKSRETEPRYPFLRTSNVFWGRVDLSDVDQMHFSTNELAEKTLRPGDLLVCEGGDIGRAALWTGGMETCAFQNHLHRLRPRREDVEPAFYRFFLEAGVTMLGLLDGIGNRTTIPNLSRNRLAGIEVPKPPLAEQRRIAAVLGKVQAAVEVEGELVRVTRELKQAALRRLFTRGLRGEPQKQTALGPVPESWTVVPMGKHLKLAQYGLSVKGQLSGACPILRMNCQLDGKVVFRNLQYVDLDEKTLNAFRLAGGDLLFNRTNSAELVGRTALFRSETEAVFASYLIRLTLDEDVWHPEFVNYFMNMESTQIEVKKLASRGVSQANISASKLKEFPIPKPALAEQRQIAAHLAAIDAKLAHHEARQKLLRELFRTLLRDLLTARRRVPESLTLAP